MTGPSIFFIIILFISPLLVYCRVLCSECLFSFYSVLFQMFDKVKFLQILTTAVLVPILRISWYGLGQIPSIFGFAAT